MCFLFSDDEFSAAALLSEESRIKNAYTDGTKFYACIIKYTCPRRCRIFAGVHTGASLQTLSQFCVNCKNISYNPKQRTQSLCPIGHIFRIGKIYNTARHISQLVQHGLEIGYLVL